MADKIESEKSKVPPTRPPRRPKAVPKTVTVKPPRPPPPSNCNLLSVPLTVAITTTPTISWPSVQTKGNHIPWEMSPKVTNGNYNEFKENEQIICYKDIPFAHVVPTPKSPLPSSRSSSRSSDSPFQSPTQAETQVLRFIFGNDPFPEITLQDVIDHVDNPLSGLDVAPDFDLPEDIYFDN